ncbi:MAG: TIGR03000 domain-containing protein [Gemmataceae bacterium]
MFSLVLMTAVAGGPTGAAFGSATSGCYGCYGSACYGSSCYGSSCFGGGCYGSSCYGSCYGSGCYGGPAFPFARAVVTFPFRVVGRAFHAFSCHGSCYGTSCHGTSCYGSSCFGCHGSAVYGGCYGTSAASPAMVYGGCYGSGCFGCSGGCYGCTGCGGAIMGADVSIPAVNVAGYTPAAPAVGTVATAGEPAVSAASALLAVHLPATATLFVDGTAVPGDGAVRRFHTPELAPGKTFYYELRAELTVNGKTQPEEMKVLVRAGETREVRFDRLLTAAYGADAGAVVRK